MAIAPKDLEQIERSIYRNAHDIAVSLGQYIDALEAHVDGMESRLHARIGDLQEKLESLIEREREELDE